MCSVLLVKLYSVMYAMPLSDECMHACARDEQVQTHMSTIFVVFTSVDL